MPAGQLLILVAFVAIFWFLLIRPQKNKQKELQRLQSALTPGNRVMLTSGIFGTVVSTSEQNLTLEIAEGIQIEVLRGAIAQVVPEDSPEDDEATDAADDVDGIEDAGDATEQETTESTDVTEETADVEGEHEARGSASEEK